MCLKAVQGIAQVSFVLSLSAAEYEYIVQIYSDELIEDRAKHVVHQPLKGTRCVHQAKR